MQHLDWFCVEMLRDKLIINMIPNLMKEVEEDNTGLRKKADHKPEIFFIG